MADSDLTAAALRGALAYDPLTGLFSWRERRSNREAGQLAGSLNDQGYVLIRLFSKHYRAHRLAWLYVTGTWPVLQIDHRDRNRANNRWSNLREATHSENHQNLVVRSDSTHGLRGVELHESGLWRARLMVRGRRIHLGYFKTAAKAAAARIAGERLHFTHSPACGPQSACPDALGLLDETSSRRR